MFNNSGLYINNLTAEAFGSVNIGTIPDSYIPVTTVQLQVSDQGRDYDLKINTTGEIIVYDRSGNGIKDNDLIGSFGGMYIC